MNGLSSLEDLLRGCSREVRDFVFATTFSQSPYEDGSQRPSQTNNFYIRLGLENFVDISEVKKAYRREMVRWHPDKNPNYYEKAQVDARALNEAYETLSDSEKKELYDTKLKVELHRESSSTSAGTSSQSSSSRATGQEWKRTTKNNFDNIPEVDAFLTIEQRLKADYLDWLIMSGDITFRRTGEYNNHGKGLYEKVDLVYKNNKMGHPDYYANILQQKGVRGLIMSLASRYSNSGEHPIKVAVTMIDVIYQHLGIPYQEPPKNDSTIGRDSKPIAL